MLLSSRFVRVGVAGALASMWVGALFFAAMPLDFTRFLIGFLDDFSIQTSILSGKFFHDFLYVVVFLAIIIDLAIDHVVGVRFNRIAWGVVLFTIILVVSAILVILASQSQDNVAHSVLQIDKGLMINIYLLFTILKATTLYAHNDLCHQN